MEATNATGRRGKPFYYLISTATGERGRTFATKAAAIRAARQHGVDSLPWAVVHVENGKHLVAWKGT